MLIAATQPAVEAYSFFGWHRQLVSLCGDLTMEIPEFGFDPYIDARAVGGITMIRHVHNAVGSERRRNQLSGENVKYLVLMLQCAGSSLFVTERGDAELAPGDLAIVDMRHPYAFRFRDRVEAVCIYLPVSALSLRASFRDRCGGTTIHSGAGIGAVAWSVAHSLFWQADALEGASAHGARDALLDIGAALASGGKTDIGQSAPTMQQRILDFADAHLADPDLGPSAIAAAHRISVRHLHRLFADSGQSISAIIRQRRLARCRRDLVDPDCWSMSVTDIAYRWGFNDSAHFSRVFKEAYSLSPREFRKMSADGRTPAQLGYHAPRSSGPATDPFLPN